jgi:hypothetical protein
MVLVSNETTFLFILLVLLHLFANWMFSSSFHYVLNYISRLELE